jgi:hypothetical protein
MIERFQYHAFATGLGGHITRPFDEIIPVQASAALPESGGFGSARVENFRFRDIVSFTSATAVVSGSQSPKDHSWGSLALVTIENLNILSMVTADRVVARISSYHPDDPGQPPSISPVGSYFENLRIAGYPVNACLATSMFARYDTFAKVCEAHHQDEHFREQFPSAAPEKRGSMGCSLFPMLEGPIAELQMEKGLFFVKGFGFIRLAQFTVTPYARRITMLQVELGSTPEGNVTGGGAEGNGSPSGH